MNKSAIGAVTTAEPDGRSVLPRARLLETHPILNRVTFETEAIRRVYLTIKFILVAGYDSCSFSAVPRSGKSTAIQAVIRLLSLDFPELPVYVFNVPRTANRYTRRFLVRWVQAVKHQDTHGDIASLEQRVIEKLADEADARGSRKVLVLMDEAQGIGEHDLQFYKEIYNELMCRDISLVTVLLGQQPDLDQKLTELKSSHGSCADLIPRFFGNRRPFRQLQVPDDIEHIFSIADDRVLVRSGGLTWSQFFAPVEWERSWRLKSEVTNLKVALGNRELLLPGDVRNGDEGASFVHTGLFFGALRHFLVELSDNDTAEKPVRKEQLWLNALRYAEYEVEAAMPAASGKNR